MARPTEPAQTAARECGATRYVSERPCKHGHVGKRYAVSTACCTCADIARTKNRAKNSTGRKPGRPKKPIKPKLRLVSAKMQAKNVEAAKSRFNRPKFANALTDYHHTIEARERSKYLNSLLKRVS